MLYYRTSDYRQLSSDKSKAESSGDQISTLRPALIRQGNRDDKVLGESSDSLLLRVVGGFVFGPLFAWYLLAKGVGGLVTMAEETNLRPQTVIQLEYI